MKKDRGRKQQKTVGGEKCKGGGKTEGGEGGTGEKGKFDSAIFSKQRSPSLFFYKEKMKQNVTPSI